MINETKVTVTGNVTRTPEVKFRNSDGRPFVVVAVAVNNRRFDADQNKWIETGTTYYDIICRNGLAGNAVASLDVGVPVIAHGKFRVHEWSTETVRGARPNIVADSIGVDLTWGTAQYAKGSVELQLGDEYNPGPPPPSEGGPDGYDEDGYVTTPEGEVLSAPGDESETELPEDVGERMQVA